MIATSHVIIGGAAGLAVGTLTKNPAAALAVGIVSHLICDTIPHLDGPIKPVNQINDHITWTRDMYIFAVADSLVAMLLTLFIWIKFFDFSFSSNYAWGAFGGYLPDLVDNFPLWSKQVQQLPGFKQFHRFHTAIHDSWQFRFPMIRYWPLGIATQIIVVAPCLWFIVK